MSRIPIILVAAVADNGVIGQEGGLPWRLKSDMAHFRAVTMGKPVVMGRKTYESIGRLLPGRTTVIVTKQRDYSVPGAIVAHSVAEALEACRNDGECFVIGGAELFRETLPIADRLYLTVVDAEPAGDTFMPDFEVGVWKETSSQTFPADEKHAHPYRFTILDRAAR